MVKHAQIKDRPKAASLFLNYKRTKRDETLERAAACDRP